MFGWLRRFRRKKTIANVRVGRPDVTPWKPSHVRGIREGNAEGHLKREKGIQPYGDLEARGTAARSTGINPKARNPILPAMPNLSPS